MRSAVSKAFWGEACDRSAIQLPGQKKDLTQQCVFLLSALGVAVLFKAEIEVLLGFREAVPKGAEAVGNAVPGSEYVPGYGEAVKQTSEQAGKDTAHVLKTIQDGGFRSKDTLREFKSQNPELDLPTS